MWQYPRAPANHRGPQATMLHSYHQAPFGPCDAFVAIIHSCLSKNRVPVSTRSNAVWCGLSSYSNLVKNWPEMSGNPHPSPSNIIQHHPTPNDKWPSYGHRWSFFGWGPFWLAIGEASNCSVCRAAPFKVLAATSEILRPARVEPVKLTRSTSGCAAMTSPRTSCGAVR